MGFTIRLGTTLRMRMATSWNRPIFTSEAVAEIHRPMGTKLKNSASTTMMATISTRVKMSSGMISSFGLSY